jgi:hypothetical protein
MYFQKRAATQLKTKLYSSKIDTIPWEEAARLYTEYADAAEVAAVQQLQTNYDNAYEKRRDQAIKAAGIDETEAAYEGDLNIEYDPPKLQPLAKRTIRAKAGNDALKEYFVKPYQFKSWGITILDQLLVEFAGHKLNALGSNGTISGLQYLKDNLDPKSARDLGVYRFLMMDSRSSYLERMYQGDARKYSALVPLILYAHKLYNNVPYSQWERETLNYVVNEELCEAMLTETPEVPADRLLELREVALMAAGKKRSAVSTYALYNLGNTELEFCPKLVKHMMLQTWVAHPTNRTKFMVLDPLNWDTMPSPLVTDNIFKKESTLPRSATTLQELDTALPWDC